MEPTSPGLPEPREQIEFLRNVQRLLSEGAFVATYKYALLHALADLAVVHDAQPDGTLPLKVSEIAEQMIALYWRQAIRHPTAKGVLRQNTGQQAAILASLEDARATGLSLTKYQQASEEVWQSLVREVQRVVVVQPLWKLQAVGRQRLPFLYAETGNGAEIVLKPGVAYCLRAFHAIVIGLVRSAWLDYVRRNNAAVSGDLVDLPSFMFGSEREDLSACEPVLRDQQQGDCFYCHRRLCSSAEVDHFIPWSRYPLNLGHNLVLAHRGCNQRKSDTLAAVTHLHDWCERNDQHGNALSVKFRDAGIDDDLEAAIRVARWSYEQAEAATALLWAADEHDLVPLDHSWRSLLGVGC